MFCIEKSEERRENGLKGSGGKLLEDSKQR